MISQIEQRLQQLKSEFESGQKMLADLESQQANVRETLLRIDGAIQVLEEILKAAHPAGENGAVENGMAENRMVENGKPLASLEAKRMALKNPSANHL